MELQIALYLRNPRVSGYQYITVMIENMLPVLEKEEKGQIALLLLSDRVLMDVGPFAKPNNARREIISSAKSLGIEPNKLLALFKELLEPNLEILFKPISIEEVAAFDKERDERRQKKVAQPQQTSPVQH